MIRVAAEIAITLFASSWSPGRAAGGSAAAAPVLPNAREAPASRAAAKVAPSRPATRPARQRRSAMASGLDPAQFRAGSAEIETGADFTWAVELHVGNPDTIGLYLDSLACDVLDLDPGETRADRTSHVDLTYLVRLVPSIPARDSTILQHSGPATSEHARLTYRLHFHRADGRRSALEARVEARPGASPEYASKFLEMNGAKIEYLIVPSASGTPAPGLLVVHGHGSHARHMIRMARQLAARGFTVALVSMPGYGQSSGPPELMGPRSVAAAEGVLDVLERTAAADSTRIAAWGISRGATVAAELAARRPDLKAVVLQSGIYDLWAAYRGTLLEGFRETIVAEAGRDSAAWRDRSPLLQASRISAPVLVLHGELDRNVPAAQAHALVAALEQHGTPVESHFSPGAGHLIPPTEVQRVALEFLQRRLKK